MPNLNKQELRKLAESCGNLNWRFMQKNWCEWAIRDNHAYIATMRTNSGKFNGPCPEREAKAKFVGAMTPSLILSLLDELEQANEELEMLKLGNRHRGMDAE
ncbi:hypothetical protein ACM72L_29035 [Pseudomonas aeruginosa]